MSTINSLLQNSANDYKNMQNDAARLAQKWSKTGLLEGLGNEIEKNNMSLILENQSKQLVTEQSATNIGGGSFTAGQGEQWAGVALPLVRKVFGSLSTKEFMSVQPMNLPSGLVFYLDFQYGQNKKLNFGAGNGDAYNATDSLYGNTDPGAGVDPSGGLFGAGRFGYSINQFQTASAATSASANWAQVNYDSELSASVAAGDLTAVTVDLPASADLNGVRAFVISGSAVDVNDILPEYTQLGATGKVVFVLNTGTVADVSDVVLFYNEQPVDNDRGDFEDQAGGGYPNAQSQTDIAIPSIDIKMKSEAIVAKTRKLKAQWTPEFAQDLNAYQSLDAEAELTSIMSEYISLEIDLENLDMLIQNASAADEYWSTKSNTYLNQAKTDWDTDLGYFNTQGQWFQTLGTKFQKVSNKIHQKTLRGGANFMVVSPSVATVLESIPGFASTSDGDAAKMNYAFGIQKAGNLNNRYQVYKNPYMTENVILMGYRGSQFLETGAVFAPYVPLIMTPLVYDPDTFTPRKGLLTRYAKKMIRPEFYGRVFVNDLASL
jgi:hypothetical protein